MAQKKPEKGSEIMSDQNKSNKTSRRKFIKQTGIIATALSLPTIFTSGKALGAPTEINMLAWYGHGEADIVAEFEAIHNVKIKPKYYAGGDNMLALIAQSPPGTYDLILSDGEFVQQLNEAGHIQQLNPSDYPFDDFIHDDFKQFPGHWRDGKLYSAMIRFGFLGVSYNRDAISEKEAMSYNCFWNKNLKGKVGHFDWHLPNLGTASLFNGNQSPGPFDLNSNQWKKVQQTMMSLRSQSGGFFDYGGTFNALKNGEMLAMCGIGDWITGALERDGARVTSVVPEEGGLQWTESYCIGKGSKKADIANEFIRYLLSPKGQVKSASMAAYPAFCVTNEGQAALRKDNMFEAQRTGQIDGASNNPIKLINDGRIHYRDLPVQQSLEDWNDFWSEYKSS